jgi:hypothetical protein
MRCNYCKGAGWHLDHHPSCRELDGPLCHQTCPIQTQCKYCGGMGEHKVDPDDIEWDC